MIPTNNRAKHTTNKTKPSIRTTAAIKSKRQLEDALRSGSFYIEDNQDEKHYDVHIGKTKTGVVELIGSIPYPIEDEIVVQTSGMEGEDPDLSRMKAGVLAVFRELLQKKKMHAGMWGCLSPAAAYAAINYNPDIISREEV